MANVANICNSFKQDLLNGLHAFGTTVVRGGTSADTFYGALIYTTGTITAQTTAWASTGISEVSGSGYTTGGQSLGTWNAPTVASSTSPATAYTTPTTALTWTGLTISSAFDTLLIYNNSASGKNAVASFNFGSQPSVSGSFSVTMPSNSSSTGLIRLA